MEDFADLSEANHLLAIMSYRHTSLHMRIGIDAGGTFTDFIVYHDDGRLETFKLSADPQFVEKAGPILDLYAGTWQGQPLGPQDFVLGLDEKTSIQARRRCHADMPPEPGQRRRIETEYERKGALQYLAAWDGSK